MDVGGVVVSEVLLSEKQHIVTVKIDPYKIVSQNYFLITKNFLELILLQHNPS